MRFPRNADFNINCQTLFHFDSFLCDLSLPFFHFRCRLKLPSPRPQFSRRVSFSHGLEKRAFSFSQAPVHALWTHFFLKGPTPRFSESMSLSQDCLSSTSFSSSHYYSPSSFRFFLSPLLRSAVEIFTTT